MGLGLGIVFRELVGGHLLLSAEIFEQVFRGDGADMGAGCARGGEERFFIVAISMLVV